MGFADIETRDNSTSTRKRIDYLRLYPGVRLIRILDTKAVRFFVHWVSGVNVKCLGDICPICENNKKIVMENPDKFREVKDYIGVRALYFVNILDRSPVKICTNAKCKREVYQVPTPDGTYAWPTTCVNCNTFIGQETMQISNRLKVLSRGKDLFEKINAMADSILDQNANPIPITAFDISLKVVGTGRDTKIFPTAITNNNDVIEVAAEDKYTLETAVVQLTPSEIVELQRGITLKDIFTARKGESLAADTKAVEALSKVTEQAAKSVESLFGKG